MRIDAVEVSVAIEDGTYGPSPSEDSVYFHNIDMFRTPVERVVSEIMALGFAISIDHLGLEFVVGDLGLALRREFGPGPDEEDRQQYFEWLSLCVDRIPSAGERSVST